MIINCMEQQEENTKIVHYPLMYKGKVTHVPKLSDDSFAIEINKIPQAIRQKIDACSPMEATKLHKKIIEGIFQINENTDEITHEQLLLTNQYIITKFNHTWAEIEPKQK